MRAPALFQPVWPMEELPPMSRIEFENWLPDAESCGVKPRYECWGRRLHYIPARPVHEMAVDWVSVQ